MTGVIGGDGKAYHQISVPGCGAIGAEPAAPLGARATAQPTSAKFGTPELPFKGFFLEVPYSVPVTLDIHGMSVASLGRGFTVFPNQPPQPDGGPAIRVPFQFDASAYRTDSFLPPAPVAIGAEGFIRGRRVVFIQVFPVQYNPATTELRAVSTLNFSLNFGAASQASDNAQAAGEARKRRLATDASESLAQRLILNYEPAAMPQSAGAASGASAAPAALSSGAPLHPGADYLIIVADGLYDKVLPLADWKRRMGFLPMVVKMSQVGSTADDVRAAIQYIYDTWTPAPSFVLLVGDAHNNDPPVVLDQYDVPAYFNNAIAFPCFTDQIYACVDGTDFFPDLAIARISVHSATDCENVVSKILAYERTPDTGDWYSHFLSASYFQDDDDNGVDDRWFMETSAYLTNYLSASAGMTSHTAWCAGGSPQSEYHYRADGYPHRFSPVPDPVPSWVTSRWVAETTASQDVSSAINAGVGLVVHRDHGGETYWFDPPFDISSIGGLNNGAKTPVVFSINCLTGSFQRPGGQCFAEAFMTKYPGGAVGIAGDTRISFSPHNDLILHGAMTCFWPSYDSSHTDATYPHSWRPAEALTYGKYYMYFYTGLDGYSDSEFYMFHWFGDPEMEMRTQTPQTLSADHPTTAFYGAPTNITVTVTEGGLPLAGARVGVSGPLAGSSSAPDSVRPFTGLTNTSGSLTLSGISLDEPGVYKIVVTHRSAIPYEGTITASLSPIGSIALDRSAYSGRSIVRIQLADDDLRGAGTHDVTVASTRGDTETVSLAERGADSGVFQGAIPTTTVAVLAEDGLLEAANGDIIAASYFDAHRGLTSATIVTTASVDCQPPVISGVGAFDVSRLSAFVSFVTDEATTAMLRIGRVAGGPYDQVLPDGTQVTTHVFALSGLTPATPYFYEVEAFDAVGNEASADNGGLDYTFTTRETSDDLTLSPSTGLNASGDKGGPFLPPGKVYTLGNAGATAHEWAAQTGTLWLIASPSTGTLAPGETTTVTLSFDAGALAAGTYTTTATFTNLDTGVGLPRSVALQVLRPWGEISVTDSIPPATDHSIPYGEVVVGTSSTAEVTIGNLSLSRDLVITSISLTGAGAANFQTMNPPALPCVIAPSGFASFGVRYLPSALRSTTATLLIESSDEDNPAVAVALSGAGVEDYLAVNPASDFVTTGEAGGPFTPPAKDYGLANNGPIPIGWSVAPSLDWAQASPASGVLAPGDSTTVTVSLGATAAALGEGTYHNTVAFRDETIGLARSREVSLFIYTTAKISAIPSPLSATVVVGRETTKTLTLYNAANATAPLDAATTISGAPWLKLVPGQVAGIAAGAGAPLAAVFDARSLNVGSYHGTILIASNDRFHTQISVPADLTVEIDKLTVTPSAPVAAGGERGGPYSPAYITYTLTNTGASVLPWKASNGDNWVSIAPDNGSLAPGDSTGAVVSFTPWANALTPTTHTATIRFANLDSGVTHDRDVVLAVSPQPGQPVDDLVVSPAALWQSGGYQLGPFDPPSQTYHLTNGSTAPLQWAAAPSAAWLAVLPPSGTIPPGQMAEATVSISSAANSLAPGAYDGITTFTRVGSLVQQGRAARLTVAPAHGEIEAVDSLPPDNDLNLPFGLVKIGKRQSEAITIRNLHAVGDLAVTTITVTQGAGPGSVFSLAGLPALPLALAPGAEATVGVIFQPPAETAYSGAVHVASNDLDEPVVGVALSGSGTANGLPDLPPLPLVGGQENAGAPAVAKYGPRDFSKGFGPGVAWAAAYYCRTAQEAAERGWTEDDVAADPSKRMSPYFLYNAGGAWFFHFAGAAMTGHGVASLAQSAQYGEVVSDAQLADAAQYMALECAPFFANTPKVDGGALFRDKWNNGAKPLKAWLAASGPLASGPFVIGVPVFQGFENLSVSNSYVYDVKNAKSETLAGFHALCVVAYDDTKTYGPKPADHGAFLVVNSWGREWGIQDSAPLRGYAWISEAFVRHYAVEAWGIKDSTGFAPAVAAAQKAETRDYKITYKGAGVLGVTAGGVAITGAGADGTGSLAIALKPGIRAGETIPRVSTDGSFSKVSTRAPVGLLTARQLKSLIATGCAVEDIVTSEVGTVKMTSTANSTWPTLSAAIEPIGRPLPNYAFTSIRSTAAGLAGKPLTANVSLQGVWLKQFDAPAQAAVVKVSSRKQRAKGSPQFVGFGGIGRIPPDAALQTDGASSATVKALRLVSVTATGAAILPDLMADDDASAKGAALAARGVIYTAKFGGETFVIARRGDVAPGVLYSSAAKLGVTAVGGDVKGGRILCSGQIAPLSARYIKYRLPDKTAMRLGGSIGHNPLMAASESESAPGVAPDALETTTPTMLVVASGVSAAGPFDIPSVYGGLGVYGLFYAGAAILDLSSPVTATHKGAIRVIATKPPSDALPIKPPGPYMQGEAHVAPGGAPAFKGGQSSVVVFTE